MSIGNPVRDVIIELRPSEALEAFASGEISLEAGLDAGAAAGGLALPGLTVDPTYTPVDLPGLVDRLRNRLEAGLESGPFDPQDTDELKQVGKDTKSYLIRGQVRQSDLDALEASAAASPEVVAIYADVQLAPTITCIGSSPVGTDADVARILGVPAMQRCDMDGNGVRVAIVDTGVNLQYLRNLGKTVRFSASESWAWDAGLTPGDMPVDHGTMVAFDVLIAAPKATILDIALLHGLTKKPGESLISGLLSDAIRAYRHLLNVIRRPTRPGQNPSLVVNNSWGMFHESWDFPVWHSGNYSDNPNHPFNIIVKTLERAGADILFAAGNCGRDCPDGRCKGDSTDVIFGANSHPAVLSVAGADINKDRVGYSSSGPGRLVKRKPDITGYTHFKGSGVYAADGGTSAACPVVAGVIAAIRSVRPLSTSPTRRPSAIRDLVIKTAEDRGAIGYDYDYGWGIVNGTALAKRLCPRIQKPDLPLCVRYPWLCRIISICERYPELCNQIIQPGRPDPIFPRPAGSAEASTEPTALLQAMLDAGEDLDALEKMVAGRLKQQKKGCGCSPSE